MRRLRPNSLWVRVVPAAALGAALTAGACKNDETPPPDNTPPPISGNFTATPATTSGNYRKPLDTVPTSDGGTFYFTAMGEAGMGVFKVSAAGGEATPVAVGDPFVSPFGIAISSDDRTLYIADAVAGHDANDPEGTTGPGRIFALPAGGGAPMLVSGTIGSRPRGLELASEGGADVLYFAGHDPASGEPAVLKIPAAGGALSVVAKGAPLTAPSGVTVSRTGDLYVVNGAGTETTTAAVYKVSGGATSELVSGLHVGYPSGIAISMEGGDLFVSGQDAAAGTVLVYRVKVATKEISSANQGIEANTDAGGLHRARSKDLFSWADLSGGATGGGRVYRVEFK